MFVVVFCFDGFACKIQLLGILAGHHHDSVMTSLIVLMVYMMCAGGFFIDLTKQPEYIAVLRFSSYWFYSMGALINIVEEDAETSDGAIATALEDYSFSSWSTASNLWALFLYGVVMRILAYIFLKTSSKIKFS